MFKNWGLFLGLIAGLSGCISATQRTTFFQLGSLDQLNQKSYERFVWENAIPADQNISLLKILDSDFASYHLAQIRNAEPRHRHDQHDALVFFQSGSGVMSLKDQSFRVFPGSVIFIPRRMPHAFKNTGAEPATAIVVFSPRYEGDDFVLDEPR